MEAAAVRTETSVLPMVELTAVQKHRDGVHLAPAGASAVAAAVAEGLQKSGALTARFVLKRLPHIGLNLSVGNEYTRDDLFAKCREKDEEPRKRHRKEPTTQTRRKQLQDQSKEVMRPHRQKM